MAKYQALSLNISPILLSLSQTGSCSVRLFGQGQAAGMRGVCATSPCCLGSTQHQGHQISFISVRCCTG